MQSRDERSGTPFASDPTDTAFPLPAYTPRETSKNGGWRFGFEENSSHDNETQTNNNPRPYAGLNTYSNATYNDNNGPDSSENKNKSSLLERVFRVNTSSQGYYAEIDTRLGNWSLLFLGIHYIAATILLCVSGVAIKLFQNPWNQPQTIGGASLGFVLGGSIVGCIAGTFSLCLCFIGYINFKLGLVLQLVLFLMYAACGGLTGYGSYLTRNNRVCNIEYAGAQYEECYNIQLASGWRCGIVLVAMSGIIVIQHLVYGTMWSVTWLKVRKEHSSRGGNHVV